MKTSLYAGKSCEEVKKIQQLYPHIEDGGCVRVCKDY